MSEPWLPSLIVAGPQEGFELALKLSRASIKATQPSEEVRNRLRPVYAADADLLISAAHVAATHFATIAAANGYWRAEQST